MTTTRINKLSHARVKELLEYDQDTGVFTWRVALRKNQIRAGDVAGHLNVSLGYVTTSIDGVALYMHRLAWFWTYGVWPLQVIDHINGNRADNRLINLRDVSNQTNVQNSKAISRKNTSGVRGVSWHKQRCKWTARIRVSGAYKSLGLFKTIKEAGAAYEEARALHHSGLIL